MKIRDLQYKLVSIPLKQRFVIALGSEDHASLVEVRIRAGDLEGYGEASPFSHVLGDNAQTVAAALDAFKTELVDIDLEDVRLIHKRMDKVLIRNESAKAAVDMALWDLLGKEAGLPTVKLLGSARLAGETDITIGIMSDEEAKKSAVAHVKEGFKALKIKVGEDPEADARRVKAIREVVGPKVQLRVDANQGYSLEEAKEFLTKVSSADIEFLEQPLPDWALDKMAELRSQSPVPIMLDESVKSFRDMVEAVKRRAADMVNIKLMKSGGITEAIPIAELAKEEDMKVMVGCMSESAVGIAAAMHFSLALSVDYVDLDSHLNHSKAVADGLVTKDGMNYLSGKPGLGVEVNCFGD
ncbi:dipeptide epimerase [Tardisphaera miroshnichenkoae]